VVVSPDKEITMSFEGARSVVKAAGVWQLTLSVLLIATVTAEAGTLDASWTAPTTNTDGSPLTDLAGYRVYYATSGSPCPGASVVQVPSPTSSPGAGLVMSYRLSGLTAGTPYNVSVSAVDASGNQSDCSTLASAVARSDFGVSPTGTVSFGSVNVGSFVDRTLTVTNTGGGAMSGSASVASPFSVVSGSPFTLSGAGASQTVTVRFAPTTGVTATANLTFAAGGSSLSTVVTGSGISTDTTPPVVTITSPTSSTTYSTASSSIGLGGTSSDNIGVTQLTWANDRGGSGTAGGTGSWSVSGVALQSGSNKLAVTARDAAGNTRTAILTVTRSDTTSTSPGSTDVTAPTISKMSISSVTASGAKIGWTTNEASDTQLEYGPTGAFGMTAGNTSRVTSHSQDISGLQPSTWYLFRARSRDAAGNVAVSKTFKFKTRSR
jgi:hypothetical protein